MPGVIAAIQTFGDRINRHPHLHFLVTEGGADEAGDFHKLPRIDDSRLTELFAREVLADLVRKELLSPEWAERILSWRHTGFSVHSQVRAKTSVEAERVGKYMRRPLLSLERLSVDEKEGKVSYRYGKEAEELERMDSLEFIARVTSHIPDKGQVMVRYNGVYANTPGGKSASRRRRPGTWSSSRKRERRSPDAHRLSRSSDGCRDQRRIFFMILSLPRRRGLGDLRLLWRLERLQGHVPPRSQVVLDIFLSHDLQSPTMIGWVNGHRDTYSASAAEKQFLINSSE